jgi:hypothetical protein
MAGNLIRNAALAARLGATSAELWAENRRLRARATDADPHPDAGLPVGSPVPELTLRTLQNAEIALRQRLATGRPAVLVHVSPGCGPCRGLVPELARWTQQLTGSLEIVTVCNGALSDAEEMFANAREHPVQWAAPGAFAGAFKARPTPSAVAVDAAGRVLSRPASGAAAIEALVRLTLSRSAAAAEPASPTALTVLPAGR